MYFILFYFLIYFFYFSCIGLHSPGIQSGPRAGLLPVAHAGVHSVVPGLAFCIPHTLSLSLLTPTTVL